MNTRSTIILALFAAGGCNSLVGFELSGGEDGGGGETKTLIVIRTGDMRGTVTSMPTGINCSPALDNCSEDYARGAVVTLTAVGAPGSLFAGWSGGGCSGTGTCTITLGIDMSIEARFEDASGGHNFVFVTKRDYSATMFNPLTNADAICMAEATANGIPGTFKAWLSTSTVDAKDRLGTARGWVRVDGLPVADTIADLTSLKEIYPIALKADGTVAVLDGAQHGVVLTGTLADGTHANTTCNDWTSPTGMVHVANALAAGGTWTDWFNAANCTAQSAIYCFGTDRNAPLTITPTPGRLAFLSMGQWSPGNGIASADALCQMEADTAGRSGTFKALLATSTASAASRFNTNGAPWVRVDGIPLAAPGKSPFDELQAPVNVWLNGIQSFGSPMATGAVTPTSTTTTSRNCNDWTATGGVTLNGWSHEPNHWFNEFDMQTMQCTAAFNLYCFQE